MSLGNRVKTSNRVHFEEFYRLTIASATLRARNSCDLISNETLVRSEIEYRSQSTTLSSARNYITSMEIDTMHSTEFSSASGAVNKTDKIDEALQRYKIQSLPDYFYYIPNFLSSTESDALLQKIPSQRWTQLSKRRLQAHPSTLTKQDVLISASLPMWLTTAPAPILARFKNLGVFADTKHGTPNHVLINEYRPGEGIMPHEDGAAYSPVVATVSLGSSIVLDIYDKANDQDVRADGDEKTHKSASVPRFRILQEPGSLLVTTGQAYVDYLHGIAPVLKDEDLSSQTIANWNLLGDSDAFAGAVHVRETRTSLTYRDVLKVSKIGLNVLGRR